jgi:hypothetical protein
MKLISTAIVLSLLVTILTSCNTFVSAPIETPNPTKAILLTWTNTADPTVTPTETPIPQSTKTAIPATLVDIEEGKQLINNKYGFTITLPPDVDLQSFNPTDDRLLEVQFPQKDLSDGGNIFTYFYVWVENQTDSCHPGLTDADGNPVKMEQVTLGSIFFNKVYTPDLDQHEMQAIEYMTDGTDFCVHFFIGLTTYYFDRRGAQPGSMLPYVQDELDSIISTFHWIRK